ncbi:MAG: hypothetical protein RJA36_2664 [Pseudomonadota bacterium]
MLAKTTARLFIGVWIAVLACPAPAQPETAEPNRQVLRVVGDENYPPYIFLDADGKTAGFVVEVWRLWEKQTGIKVELKALKWEEAQRTLLRGDADVIDNIFKTPGRASYYDFTPPYAELPVAIYRDVSISGINNQDTLRGFRVGVMKGDACVEKLQNSGITSLAYYDNYTELIRGAIAQDVKVFCLDEYPANFYLYQLGAHRQFVKAFELYRGQFHRAVRKGQLDTLRLVEQGMAAIPAAQMEALRAKWLRAPIDYQQYSAYVVEGGMVLLLAAGVLVIWNISLRHRVAARTAEIRQAEQVLLEREQQLRSIGDNLPGGFVYQFEADPPRFRYVSAGIARVLGMTPESTLADARPVFALIGSEARPWYDEAHASSVRDMSDFSLTLPFDLPGQGRRWLQIQSRPRRLQDGSMVWDGVATDVTEQKKTQQELDDYRHTLEHRVDERTADLRATTEKLNSSNERLDAILNNASAGIMLVRQRRIEHCNHRLESMTGYERGELEGQPLQLLYADEDAWQEALEAIDAILATGQGYAQEQQVRRKDGGRFWVRFSASALDMHDLGKGMVGMMADITIERAAIENMSRARAMAEDAARTKAEFLANMSHEIRTPMNSIIGMAILALKADPTPRVRDYLQKIQSSSQLLLGIINDILDFSKLEAGKMSLEQVEFGLDQLLDSIHTVFAEKTARKGLEFVIDVASDVPTRLVGDPLRVEQILINLISNAVKFTEHGEIIVHVGVLRRAADEVVLRFAVQDSGIGISDEQGARLFQSFQQADSATTRKFGGTGLGLAISKKLAELLGGQIGVTSVPGAGSTFWFTAALKADHAAVPHYQLQRDLHGMRALVVDDNAPAREVIAEMLRSMGFLTTSLASGAQALAMIEQAEREQQHYDLVLLDWKMPAMNGVELAREIQRKSLEQPPLMLMITAFDRDEVLPAAQQVGIGEVLLKPVTPSALLNAVMRQFDQQIKNEPVAGDSDVLSETTQLRGARALLVEDNELNQEVASEFLRALGLQVDLAEDGSIALQRLARQDYDVVLMDMQMPVMDGITATRAIRQLPRFKQLPILAMTANAMAEDRERCLAAGMNDHIAKPIDPQDLVNKLLRWVKPELPRPG